MNRHASRTTKGATRVRRVATLALACLLAACGGGGGGTGGAGQPPTAPVPPPPPPVSVFHAGLSMVKLRTEGGGWVAMTEKPHGFMDQTVMERQLELSDADGRTALAWQPPAGWTLVDFALHPGREITAVLSNGSVLGLVRLDSKGRQLAMQTFSDPGVALDPYFGNPAELRDRTAMSPLKTLDAVRVAPAGAHLGLALRAGGNNVVAYRFDYANGAFTQRWRTLVEPGIYLDGLRPTSGSYDPFDGVDNHWQVQMDIDARGRMAVAVLVSSRAGLASAHAAHFRETLPATFVEGVLLTVVDEQGVRAPALAIDNREKSEVHALKWSGESVLVAGRVRSSRAAGGDGWDGYVARADAQSGAAPRLVTYRLVDVDRGDVVFDLLPLDAATVLLAGATGYTQNPGGESVSDTSTALLARLDTASGTLSRIAVQQGPRGNQLRALAAYRGHWLAGGMQNVPGTHSADGNPALLTTDAWLRELDAVN
jgi:hypothetical protein